MMMKQVKFYFAAAVISILLLFLAIYFQSVEIHHLESENAKFKQEIEYLKGSNELLREDNVKFQDALWHYHDMKMKEGDSDEF